MGKFEKIKNAPKKNASPKQKEASVRIFLVWLTVTGVLAVIIGLWLIKFISVPFATILSAAATGYGLFKTGYFWRDIRF